MVNPRSKTSGRKDRGSREPGAPLVVPPPPPTPQEVPMCPGTQHGSSDMLLNIMMGMQQQQQQQMTLLQQQLAAQKQQIELLQQQQQQARPSNFFLELKEAHAPTFAGSTDPLEAEKWINEMEKFCQALCIPKDEWVNVTIPFLIADAQAWFISVRPAYEFGGVRIDWAQFRDIFFLNYFPATFRIEKENEFFNLKQGSMTVIQYASMFNQLGCFAPAFMVQELSKVTRFEEGLNLNLREYMGAPQATTYQEVLEQALRAEKLITERNKIRDSKRPMPWNEQDEETESAANKKATSANTVHGQDDEMSQQQNGSYIISPEERYKGKLTHRGGHSRVTTLISTWEEHGLMNRARECVFSDLITILPDFKAAGKLVHHAFMHRVHTDTPNELHFRFNGSTICRFGRLEFGLITGLPCGAKPSPVQCETYMRDTRLIDTYFGGITTSLKFHMIEDAFTHTKVVEDAWRLGLVFFVEGFLYERDDSSPIWKDLLCLVEDPDRFCRYPWGTWTFDHFHDAIVSRNWRHYIGNKKEVPCTLYGWVSAFQFWLYETIPDFGRMWADFNEGQGRFPRMLSWRCRGAPQFKAIVDAWSSELVVNASLVKLPDDLQHLLDIGFTKAEVHAHVIAPPLVSTPPAFAPPVQAASSVPPPVVHAYAVVSPPSSPPHVPPPAVPADAVVPPLVVPAVGDDGVQMLRKDLNRLFHFCQEQFSGIYQRLDLLTQQMSSTSQHQQPPPPPGPGMY